MYLKSCPMWVMFWQMEIADVPSFRDARQINAATGLLRPPHALPRGSAYCRWLHCLRRLQGYG